MNAIEKTKKAAEQAQKFNQELKSYRQVDGAMVARATDGTLLQAKKFAGELVMQNTEMLTKHISHGLNNLQAEIDPLFQQSELVSAELAKVKAAIADMDLEQLQAHALQGVSMKMKAIQAAEELVESKMYNLLNGGIAVVRPGGSAIEKMLGAR